MEKTEQKTPEEMKKQKELGLKEYFLWYKGSFRGHRIVGEYIKYRFGLAEEDFKPWKNKRHNEYMKRYQKKVRAEEKQKRISIRLEEEERQY